MCSASILDIPANTDADGLINLEGLLADVHSTIDKLGASTKPETVP